MGDRKVYLLLTDTGTLFTRMIKLYTKQCHNHASVGFDCELTEVYSFGRKRPRNPFVGGFVKEDIRSQLFKNASCAIYVFTVNEKAYNKMFNYIKEMDKNQHKYRYNLLGLFAIALNKRINRKHAFFCSHFVAMVLNEGMLLNINKHPCMITPKDLMEASSQRLIYKGSLQSYISFREQYLKAQ